MTFRFDTRHLNSQQQAIVRQRERDHQILKEEEEKKCEKEIEESEKNCDD